MYQVSIMILYAIIAYSELNYCNAATCSKKGTLFRTNTRNGLKNNKFEVFVVVSFKFITDDDQVNEFFTKNFIIPKTRIEQIEMFKMKRENYEILRFREHYEMNYRVKELFKFSSLSAIEEINCIENPEDVDVYVASLEESTELASSKVTMLHACKIWNDNRRDVLVATDSIILLLEGNCSASAVVEAKKILNQRQKTFNVRYSFVDKTELCTCDEILNYYNECPARYHLIDNRHIMIGIFTFICLLCFGVAIYPRLFKIVNNRVSQESGSC